MDICAKRYDNKCLLDQLPDHEQIIPKLLQFLFLQIKQVNNKICHWHLSNISKQNLNIREQTSSQKVSN